MRFVLEYSVTVEPCLFDHAPWNFALLGKIMGDPTGNQVVNQPDAKEYHR